ncbi:hypothetical protein KY328_04595 [Candidatus Woesearchaeota archaeon]|nr:hypothetical protein [Candidatus Woesearchaeota archaeon]
MIDKLNEAFLERLKADKQRLENLLTNDSLKIPGEAWENVSWEFMDPQKRDEILARMFQHTLARAKSQMSIYENADFMDPKDFKSMEQLVELPLLVKDGSHGFRLRVLENPELLRPKDATNAVAYFSGGTKGQSTPTYITPYDLDIEGRALAWRCFVPGALHQGMDFYNFYNPTHKGGRLIEDALKCLGARTLMTRRPEDGLDICVDKIKAYGVNAVAAVQPPISQSETIKKGSGVSFLNLFEQDPTLWGREGIIKYAFITGYKLPEEVIELSKDIGLHLFTTWGASEAIPGATSTVLGPETRKCKYNNQHLTYGPHVLSVVKIDEDKPRLAKVGEEGLLLVTTIAREGTIYINYAIGDKATVVADKCDCGRTTPIITNIHRADPKELEGGGCRYC